MKEKPTLDDIFEAYNKVMQSYKGELPRFMLISKSYAEELDYYKKVLCSALAIPAHMLVSEAHARDLKRFSSFSRVDISSVFNKETVKEMEIFTDNNFRQIAEIKCECGSDKLKLPAHSDWCPKYKK